MSGLTLVSARAEMLRRLHGGVHFRFGQNEGGRLGRSVATYVCKHSLRPKNGPHEP